MGKSKEFRSSDCKYVWRSKGEPFNLQNNVVPVKHGGSNILLWGCFDASAAGTLQSGWNNEGGAPPPNSSASFQQLNGLTEMGVPTGQ